MRNFLIIALLAFGMLACLPDDENLEGGRDFPEIIVSDVSFEEGDEGNSMLDFTLTLSGTNTTNVIVSYSTIEGTATAEEDYIPQVDGRLTFSPAETEKKISIEIIGDEVIEGDEFFELLIFNPLNAFLTTDRVKGNIINDDADGGSDIPNAGYETPESYDGLELVFRDEFDGTEVNKDFWTFEIGTGNNGWGNNELQYYREENTTVEDGYLIIEAREEAFGGSNYTSSRMITKDKEEFQFGRIDIRAVLPEGQGIWPALWMLGTNIDQVGWPGCGEIDIMELVGHQPNRVHGTVHYGASFAQHQFTGTSTALSGGEKFADEFHVFSLIWEEDNIQILMDDVPYFEIGKPDLGNNPYPFNQPFFFIFNVAVGGNWPGSPDNTTVFPQRMIVDYVRVFQ